MESKNQPLANPKDKRILIVDDDTNVLTFLEMAAQLEGFDVVTATNGTEAAEKVAQRPPDLIITDLMMPGQGGYEFIRALQGAGNASIPIIVVSGSHIEATTVAMIRQEANVVEFLRKPVPMNTLADSLHHVLHTAAPPKEQSPGINERPKPS
ncbi:MAG TPA: hypothetical protein DEB40_08025 [Elusimicrobia bacterium]|nr:hypothetical protein [Elusimicrobiota bacterium]HBT61676.1 hypothetical protein [Elusimicrobiota bacterium]